MHSDLQVKMYTKQQVKNETNSFIDFFSKKSFMKGPTFVDLKKFSFECIKVFFQKTIHQVFLITYILAPGITTLFGICWGETFHCRFLVPRNTQKILTKIWLHFWLKMMIKSGLEVFILKFTKPLHSSEIAAKLPGQFTHSGQIFLH